MNRNIDSEELVDFAESMISMFPRCFFNIINVRDNPCEKSPKASLVRGRRRKYTITEVCFNDEHPKGRDKSTNPSFWLGNTEIWNSLLLQYFQLRRQRYARQLFKNIIIKAAGALIRKIRHCVKKSCE